MKNRIDDWGRASREARLADDLARIITPEDDEKISDPVIRAEIARSRRWIDVLDGVAPYVAFDVARLEEIDRRKDLGLNRSCGSLN